MYSAFLIALSVLSTVKADHIYSATYLPSNLPDHTEDGQSGTNQCGTGLNQTSMCQTAYLNALDDWCLWAPPEPGPHSSIGETERIEVAWCTKNGTGARLIPDGAITGAHWLITPDYIQVTGKSVKNDLEEEESWILTAPMETVHGSGLHATFYISHFFAGNPVGGIVFSNAFGGQTEEIFEWTNFMGPGEFCFRICDPKGKNPAAYCQHIYDEMGCDWNMPANYGPGFDSCHADSGEPMGVYGGSTFHQGDAATPPAHAAPKPTSCSTVSSIGNGFIIQGTNIITPSATPSATVSGASGASGSPTASGSGSRSGSGSGSGAPAPTNSNNSAGRGSAAASIQSWERTVMSVGLAIVFSLVGAAVVL
ncbi:hypothetical protein MVEN_02424200 [Mycena venus]|uniref:Macrofage activating glycoprotein n=1 Tax=Mycena venus TaxID=2733690 RepID=A0A8H6WY75_9AGAR|nr:hypothetical protein MVEN_02424200 [Mycena venus]